MNTQRKTAKQKAKRLFTETKENIRIAKRLKRAGFDNGSIAAALGIPDDSPVIQAIR